MLIFLIGVRGAGKTSCVDALRGRTDVVVLEPSTTRQPRSGADTEYDFRAAFDVPMAWQINVGAHLYGMRQSQVDGVPVSQVGVTVFEPGNIQHLLTFKQDSVHEVVVIGLDTVETAAEQVPRVGNDPRRAQTQGDIDAQRRILEEHADLLLSGDLQQNIAAVQTTIRVLRNRGGLLDRQSVLNYLRAGTLLHAYEEGQAETASYDLRLGDELLFDGKLVPLTAERPSFKIPPYAFIIARSLEQADIPKFLAGRFDLRVSLFMKGIILSNGPQVDPGFRGALFCMLYNASDQDVPIKLGEHFATLEFHTTALSTSAARHTAYHYFENTQRLSAEILERPGSKLLARIDAVEPRIVKVVGGWTAGFGLLTAALLVFVAWSFTTLTDVQKAGAELRRQLDDAKDTAQKLKEERSSFQSESQRALADLKSQLEDGRRMLKELEAANARMQRR